jgi:hypothetical protein
MEKIAGREAESTLKEGKCHNFISIGCRKIFTSSRAPLQHGTVREKVVHNKFANVAFICDGWLEQVRVQGGHGWEEVSLRWGIRDCEEEDEKWRQCEKWLGLTTGSLFNSSGNKGTRNDPPRCA